MEEKKRPITVRSRVRKAVKEEGLSMSSEFYLALESTVRDVIKDATARAKANRRTTARARDI
jgi:histone H3/H4